jgi:DeoR/GlpR family transcriptional regulator of sugar metabolism
VSSVNGIAAAPTARQPALGADRRRLILQYLRAGDGAQVTDLAQRFGVSQMTVRRDLARLAREGKLTRVHGGAVHEGDEPPFGTILVERAEAKARVGRAAAALIEDGQTVMIDIGTTTLALARQLHGRSVTVITSNLAVVEELLPEPEIELVVLGGVVRRNYRSLVGVLAEDALRQVSADVCFLGASGFRRDDLAVMDTTMAEVPIKRGMLAASTRGVLLVDAGKFSMTGTVRVCGAEDLDLVVTDATDDEPSLASLARIGVEVVRA